MLENINLDNVKSEGYAFQIELTYRVWLKNFKIEEVPIVFHDRTHGESKLSPEIFWEAVVMVWWLRFNKNEITRGKL